MKKKSLFKISTISLLVFGLLFLHFYAPRFITEIRNPLIELIRSNKTDSSSTLLKQNQKTITFKSFDNTQISCLITYSQLDSISGTIILLHGIRSNKESFNTLADRLANIGYNSVAVDSRAHGQSKGQFCTFGVKEKRDASSLIDTLIETEKFKNIGIWGQSLGGAIGLQAMSIDKRIKFGIIESTFSDFNKITQDYFKIHLGFNISTLTKYLIHRAGIISDFDPNEAKPLEYCKNIDQPILLVHGNKDRRINIRYAKENFENIASNKKQFLEIESANHLNVWKTGGEKYFETVFEFIKRNTTGNNGYK